jgi:hypothetical protein
VALLACPFQTEHVSDRVPADDESRGPGIFGDDEGRTRRPIREDATFGVS